MSSQVEIGVTATEAWSGPANRQAAQPAKTRVLLLTNTHDIGGMEEHVELLARHLDRQRFEVFAICPEQPYLAPFLNSMAVEADHVAAISTDHRSGFKSRLSEAIRLYRQIRAWRIDVMHIHSGGFNGNVSALAVARLAGIPRVVLTEHLAPDAPLTRPGRWIRNAVSWMVDGIVSVSGRNLEARRRHLYTPASRAFVVKNGIDLDDFPPISDETRATLRAQHNIPVDAPIVGTVVRFEQYKGLAYLLDAMPAILAACPKAVLLMVGDGPLRAELEAHVARLGLTENVRFVGFQNDPRPYMAIMDAFVLPVPWGSMSIALLEAMAMERAAVITFGGEGEAIIHGESGFCAEPCNPQSIAEYVIQILCNPELKQALGAAARKRVEEQFSMNRVAREVGAISGS